MIYEYAISLLKTPSSQNLFTSIPKLNQIRPWAASLSNNVKNKTMLIMN